MNVLSQELAIQVPFARTSQVLTFARALKATLEILLNQDVNLEESACPI